MPSIKYYNSIIGTQVKVSGQNVGIGTSAPLYKLDTNGSFRADSININDQYTFPTSTGSIGHSLVYAGSNQVVWSGVSGNGGTEYIDGSGLSLNGTEFNINTDNTTIEINADTLRIKDGGVTSAKIAALDDLLRWEYPDKLLDSNIYTLGYIRLYDESNGYCGLGVSASSFNIGTSGVINLRFIGGNNLERAKIDTAGNFIINENGYTTDFRVEGDADEYLLYAKGGGGADKVGIGTNILTGKLNVYQTTTNNSNQVVTHSSANHYTTSNSTNYVFGNYTDIRKLVASGITDNGYVMGHECNALLADEGSLASAFGLRTYAGINNQSDNGSLTYAYGIQSRVINNGQGTANINTAHGVNVYIEGDLTSPSGNGKITNAFGLYINPLYNVTTNAYGLYVAAMESATTNRYGIYQNGTNDTNVLMGGLGIGTNVPSQKASRI